MAGGGVGPREAADDGGRDAGLDAVEGGCICWAMGVVIVAWLLAEEA